MKEVTGKYNTAKVFTDVVEQSAIDQIRLLCDQPFTQGASIRIMPIVTTIGQAAGTAAAIAVNTGKGVKEIDVQLLREKLAENGAFI